jgi:hypothetical protein
LLGYNHSRKRTIFNLQKPNIRRAETKQRQEHYRLINHHANAAIDYLTGDFTSPLRVFVAASSSLLSSPDLLRRARNMGVAV